jgi:hypothetical protein
LGEVQLLKLPPSSLHSKVEFASDEEKVKLGEALPIVPEGPESIDVSGAAVSTVHV